MDEGDLAMVRIVDAMFLIEAEQDVSAEVTLEEARENLWSLLETGHIRLAGDESGIGIEPCDGRTERRMAKAHARRLIALYRQYKQQLPLPPC